MTGQWWHSAVVESFGKQQEEIILLSKKPFFILVLCRQTWNDYYLLTVHTSKLFVNFFHWRDMMVDGAEFGISWQWLAFLSILSCWQLIQNSVPSTILLHQCDISIENKWAIGQGYLLLSAVKFEATKFETTHLVVNVKSSGRLLQILWPFQNVRTLWDRRKLLSYQP